MAKIKNTSISGKSGVFSLPQGTTVDRTYGPIVYTDVGSTTWTCPPGVTAVQVLVVGGGGGGGRGFYGDGGGGGGGGGGVVYHSNYSVTPGNFYPVTVGAGGVPGIAGGGQSYAPIIAGANGGNSVFGNITALGGGGGGSQNGSAGSSGGSGGGGAGGGSPVAGAGGSATQTNSGGGTGYGNAGGAGAAGSYYGGGGGGGAGGAGNNAVGSGNAGIGGNGLPFTISGITQYYGGGGGGGLYLSNAGVQSTGGVGGGGNGGQPKCFGAGVNGAENTGGGGGGGTGTPPITGQSMSGGANGGYGGSGIVIINPIVTVVQTYTSGSGNWTAPEGVNSVEVLVVAGGGGGGRGEGNVNGDAGGGGGAGGLLYRESYPVTPGTSYSYSVGPGGAGSSDQGSVGGNGSNSNFDILVAIGGGGGGGGGYNALGVAGGSGGGSGGEYNRNASNYDYVPATFIGARGVANQGNNGGVGYQGYFNRGGAGGGGAGQPGSNPTPNSYSGQGGISYGGAGGKGLPFDISGTMTYYAGGGGGGFSLNFASGSAAGGPGGLGGGGNGGGSSSPTAGVAGNANTGGGGGGGSADGSVGGNGGSGVVILRYHVLGSTQPEGSLRYNNETGFVEAIQKLGGGQLSHVPIDSNINYATGGKIRDWGTYRIHTWDSATDHGTFIPRYTGNVEVLVVAGGGGGGVCYGGGGGGGGVIYHSAYQVVANNSYRVRVGTGGSNQINVSGSGGPGENSQFGNLVAIGGGYGGGNCGSHGGAGGSGGGASSTGTANSHYGGAGVSGQGGPGGSAGAGSFGFYGGGGGGAGAAYNTAWVGELATGRPGEGFGCSISGTFQYYGGGGAGAGSNTTPGGTGGGGFGGTSLSIGNANGQNGTGGGGGGSIIAGPGGTSGWGGSGIVIVRYQVLEPQAIVQKFTTVGTTTWTAPAGVHQVEALVVAGGGSGAVRDGSGGGAGGVVYTKSYAVTPGQPYTVTVGAGGAARQTTEVVSGFNGSNSQFDSIVAIGGGGGSASSNQGLAGGSGGGTGGNSGSGPFTGGLGTVGQGHNGGYVVSGLFAPYTGAGGGGAGGPGENVTINEYGAAGGPGLMFDITGVPTWYGGGGGGAGSIAQGKGGIGGGGSGHNGSPNAGGSKTDGEPNTGGGGGCARSSGQTSGAGGSGIVVLRYYGNIPGDGLTSETAAISANAIKTLTGTTESGVYWILVNGVPTQLYCHMTMAGGGWTLIGKSGPGLWNGPNAWLKSNVNAQGLTNIQVNNTNDYSCIDAREIAGVYSTEILLSSPDCTKWVHCEMHSERTRETIFNHRVTAAAIETEATNNSQLKTAYAWNRQTTLAYVNKYSIMALAGHGGSTPAWTLNAVGNTNVNEYCMAVPCATSNHNGFTASSSYNGMDAPYNDTWPNPSYNSGMFKGHVWVR